MRRTPWLPCLLLVAPAAPAALAAQAVRKSQHATVTQLLGTTEVTIVYNRPSARGRKVFGGLVAWGKVWDPGADEATTITFSHDVLLAGWPLAAGHDALGSQPLAAGKYSVWAIPEPEEWTLIFNKAADVFHVPYPGQAEDALRLKVKPQAGPFLETLAFYFPSAEADHALLSLHWGTTIVQIRIAVRSP